MWKACCTFPSGYGLVAVGAPLRPRARPSPRPSIPKRLSKVWFSSMRTTMWLTPGRVSVPAARAGSGTEPGVRSSVWPRAARAGRAHAGAAAGLPRAPRPGPTTPEASATAANPSGPSTAPRRRLIPIGCTEGLIRPAGLRLLAGAGASGVDAPTGAPPMVPEQIELAIPVKDAQGRRLESPLLRAQLCDRLVDYRHQPG